MGEPTAEDVISAVSSIFDVVETEREPDLIRFRITDHDVKPRFVRLVRRLEPMGLVCRLDSGHDGLRVLVSRMPPRKGRRWMSESWMPRLLFGIVVAFVMIDGYYRTVSINRTVHIGDPLEMAIVYTLALLGILGVHELGHLAASKWHNIRTTWPYFIPGIPIYGIPTFGAFIQSKGLTINREILFDIAIAGPVAGLAVAVMVAIAGAYAAPVMSAEEAEQLYQEQELIEWDLGEPLLMTAAFAAFGKTADGQVVLLTPLVFAAWIGFLVTFLNLLPAWQLDGGHMARTLFGERWHRYATFASMGVLVLLGYWIMAMFILVLSSRSSGARPLDDISPLPRSRRAAYAAVVALAVLCAPLPSGLLP